ncbi:MAG: hypothetical protein FJ144_20775 [Deltaproteobacteria bacterium]|nr:hypothetical protein [Deltaproteobacteria bacterium]
MSFRGTPLEGEGRGLSPAWSLASYATLFAALAVPYSRELAVALPEQPSATDSQVITWVLAWVSHSLAVDPLGVYEANVGHPMPRALIGTHHLFSSQLLFGPIYAVTGNPVLSANLAAWITYPLSALAMERLLRALGARAGTAWVVGLLFALGVMRVPFNVHVLQYPNLFFPWVALALVRLRREPSGRHAVQLFLAFGLGIFACFYEAVLVAIVAAVWGLYELVRERQERVRYLARALVPAIAAAVLLLIVVLPYVMRPTTPKQFPLTRFGLPLTADPGGLALLVGGVLSLLPKPIGTIGRSIPEILALFCAAASAIAVWWRGSALARRVVPVALVLWLLGGVLSWGYPEPLASLVERTPLSFFRYPYRFAAIGDFGLLLLVAVALDALCDALPRRVVPVAIGVLAGVVVWTRGVPFGEGGMQEVASVTTSAGIYDEVARVLEQQGGGALLELPIEWSDTRPRRTLEPSAMLASTRHWWRTPALHMSYHPPHRFFFRETVLSLPEPWALDDLVDLTHVRWLLLRPATEWNHAEQRVRLEAALRAHPAVGDRIPIEDWLLVRLDREPGHPGWYETVASGGDPKRSVLGTPLEPLAEEDAIAVVSLDGEVPERAIAGERLVLPLRVRNEGRAPWPAVPAPDHPLGLAGTLATPLPLERLVLLAARWHPADVPGEPASGLRMRLRRDVDPGETIEQPAEIPVPEVPGEYDLEIRIEQKDGARFTDPRNVSVRRRIRVDAPAASQGGDA